MLNFNGCSHRWKVEQRPFVRAVKQRQVTGHLGPVPLSFKPKKLLNGLALPGFAGFVVDNPARSVFDKCPVDNGQLHIAFCVQVINFQLGGTLLMLGV